jgi:hypothetical protein
MAAETYLNLLVDRQLPEFVREDYPTFVAFVEAYYEYMVDQGVDISDLKDLDKTMEDFVQYFKNELAVNLPIVVQDERLLLQHIKDHYLSKGSEGSYKLLFRLLFGKNVELTYPGESMLIPSDGRWNQEISVFVNVDYGNPEEVVGKLVEISSGERVLSVLIDRKEELIGEVDRVKQVGDNVYEMYLDKRFFGEIEPNDKIRYLDEFQATILPATSNIKITQKGIGFRVGQVFELKQGNGTGALLKITETNSVGGIQRAELIKFGIGYVADFALSILSTNSVTAKQTAVSATATRVTVDTYVASGSGAITFEGVTESDGGSTILQGVSGATFGGIGEPQINDEIWTSGSDSQFVGVITAISSDGTEATLADIPSFSGTSELYEFYNPNGDGTKSTYIDDFGVERDSQWSTTTLGDRVVGFEEQGYLNISDVFAYEFIDSTYAGTILREFALNSANAQADSDEPAIIEISLGALNRYPGYFESNAGFVSDSIFIQDSFYYQKFSYVLRIDERLNKYKSAVRTMVHPAGMKLFGEFDISNNFDLSVALESLVKSLGISLETDYRDIDDEMVWLLTKVFGDSVTITAPEADVRKRSFKVFADTATPDDEDWTHFTTKALESDIDTPEDDDWTHSTTKRLDDAPVPTDEITKLDTSKRLSDSQSVVEDINKIDTDKYIEDNSVGSIVNRADIYVNSYNAQDYWIYTEEYEGGLAETTTN